MAELASNVGQEPSLPEQLIPTNFREALAAIAVLVALIFLFVSLFRNQRDHALRGTGLFLVFAIVLFANHVAAYFAAVFIVATAVTQLEFLQNLAAILRGASKEYFKYHREFLPPREVEAEVAQEVAESEAAAFAEAEEAPGTARNLQGKFPSERQMTAGQFGILVEEFAFKFLESKYGKSIERHVRFVRDVAIAEFDGVMREQGFDRIFEIKASRLGVFPQHFLVNSVKRISRMLVEYQKITGRRPVLDVVLLGNFSPNFQRRLREYRQAVLAECPNLEVQFETLSFDEIGLSFENE